jgi:hypothetical protein
MTSDKATELVFIVLWAILICLALSICAASFMALLLWSLGLLVQ